MVENDMEQAYERAEGPFVSGAFGVEREAESPAGELAPSPGEAESEGPGYSPYPAGEYPEIVTELPSPEMFYRAFLTAWRAVGGPPLPCPPAGQAPAPAAPPPPAPSAQVGSGPKLGALSEKYESNGKPGTVSGGVGDPGGVSYGLYQMTSKNYDGSPGGTVKSFVEKGPYRAELSGHAPGSPGFSAAWRAIAARDPAGFSDAQWRFIKATHYDVQAAMLRQEVGLDPDRRSNALQQVVWSTAVHHGPRTKVVLRALAGRSPASIDDAALITAVFAERGKSGSNGRLAYFPRVSPAWDAGLRRRFQSEAKDALAMLQRERAGGAQRELYEGPARAAGWMGEAESEEAESPFLGEAMSYEGEPFPGEMEAEHPHRHCRCCLKAEVEAEVDARLSEHFSWLPSWVTSLWPWPSGSPAPQAASPDIAALDQAIAAGVTSPVKLTDIVFYARHPERGQRPIAPGEAAAIDEWKAIQRDVVVPRLGSQPSAPPATPYQPPATPYQPPAGSGSDRFPPMRAEVKIAVPHMKQGPGQCYVTSVAMAKAVGIRGVKGYSLSTVYQIALAEDSKGRVTSWDDRRGAEGVAYLDSQLERRRPVVVGISYKDASYNGDKITDHFILVTSRYVDAQGRRYYGFYDPALPPPRGTDDNPNNRFVLDPVTRRLSRPQKPGVTSPRFDETHWDVSMIRINEE